MTIIIYKSLDTVVNRPRTVASSKAPVFGFRVSLDSIIYSSWFSPLLYPPRLVVSHPQQQVLIFIIIMLSSSLHHSFFKKASTNLYSFNIHRMASSLAPLDATKLKITKTSSPKEKLPNEKLVFGQSFTDRSIIID